VREETVFGHAIEIDDPVERAGFLDRACAGDDALRATVEELLRWHFAASGFLTRPAIRSDRGVDPTGEPPPDDAVDPLLGESIEGVTLVGLLGEGGFAKVYEGVQHHPRRRVAVKVLRAGLSAPTSIERFQLEADILAGLDHPGIARVFASGQARGEGAVHACFVMELVDGATPITAAAACRDAPLRGKLELFREVCAAVAHAHRQGIVHRDLKPANILVDAAGRPKVIDFGWARLLGEGAVATEARTFRGQLVGTFRYMSPEQFEGDSSLVEARADVWALGVILHEILVGALPFNLAGRTVYEAAAVVRAGLPIPLPRLAGRLPRDVSRIIATCLETVPERRYTDAGVLADELERYLAGRPVRGCRLGFFGSLLHLAQRHALGAGMTLGVVAVLVAAIAGAWRAYDWAERESHAARRIRYQASVQRLSALLPTAVPAERATLLAAAEELAAEVGLASADAAGPVELAIVRSSFDRAIHTWRCPAPVEAVACSPDGRTVALGCGDGVVRLRHTNDGGGTVDLVGHRSAVKTVAFDRCGTTLVSGAADGEARVWDVASALPVAILAGHASRLQQVAFDPAGRRVATASHDRKAALWDAASGETLAVLRDHAWRVGTACFDPVDGRWLASASQDGTTMLWNTASGRSLATFRGRNSNQPAVAFSPDGTTLAVASSDWGVRLVDTASHAAIASLPGPEAAVVGIEFSPDGRRLLFVTRDETVHLWHVATHTRIASLGGHLHRIHAASFSPDGTRVATGSQDRTMRLWDAADGRLLDVLSGHHREVRALDWTSDGRRIVTASTDGTARLWDARNGRGELHGMSGQIASIAFDGDSVVAHGDDGSTCRWSVADGARLSARPRPAGTTSAVAVSANGLVRAVGTGDGRIRLEPSEGEPIAGALEPLGGGPRSLRFSLDGRRLLGVDAQGSVRLCDTATGMTLIDACDVVPRLTVAEIDPGGGGFAVGGANGHIARWKEGKAGLPVSRPLESRVRLIVWRPGHDEFVAAADDGGLVLCEGSEVSGDGIIRRFPRLPSAASAIAFSPDGTRLVAGCDEGQIRAWGVDEPGAAVHVSGHDLRVSAVAWNSDGSRFATGSDDQTVRLWDAADGIGLLVLRGHEAKVSSVALSPDGRWLASASTDGGVRLWGGSSAGSDPIPPTLGE